MPDIFIPKKLTGDRIEWKPNAKQAEFLSLPYSIKEGFYGGGAGSGKSDVLLMYGIVHKFYENVRFKQVFMRRTRPELKREIVGRSRELYRPFGATYNGSDMVWTFPRPDQYGSGGRMPNDGAQIFLGHCEEEKNVHIYDSMEIPLFTPDELTSYTEWIYLYITFERNRAPRDSGLPSITRAAGMPGGIGHTFTKKRFIDPYKEGGKIIVGKGGNKRIYIHATYKDNEQHIDPTYGQSLDGRPEAERKAKKFGDWSAYLGSVFDEFRDKNYPDEPDNAIHVIEPFDIPSWWPRFFIGDWGFAAMCYIGFYAVSPTGRLYLYRELYWTKTKISEWGAIVKGYCEIESPKIVKFCRSAAQDRGGEHTIQEQIETAIGRSIELSINSSGSRISGKMLVHEFLRWKPLPEPPESERPVFDENYAQWLFRNKSEQEYKSYLKMFEVKENTEIIPRLQIFKCKGTPVMREDGIIDWEDNHEGHPNCCPVMIDTIKACSYDKPGSDGKAPEDVAEFSGDDPYDDLRYACQTADAYLNEANAEFKRLQREAEIVERLRQNQNMTQFYMAMRKNENVTKMKPVKMYHRRR